jgi:hypothetical protein
VVHASGASTRGGFAIFYFTLRQNYNLSFLKTQSLIGQWFQLSTK